MYKLLLFTATVVAGIGLFKFLKKGKDSESETIISEQEQTSAA